MKNILSSRLLFITALLTLTNNATANGIDGLWLNSDPATTGITKMMISEIQPGELLIKPFGKCHPVDCEWALMSTQISDNEQPIQVSYSNDYKSVELSMSLYNANTLEVIEKRIYHSSSDQIHEVHYLMNRQPNIDDQPIMRRLADQP